MYGGLFGPSWGPHGASWARFGSHSLRHVGAMLEPCLDFCWKHIDPPALHFGTSAVTSFRHVCFSVSLLSTARHAPTRQPQSKDKGNTQTMDTQFHGETRAHTAPRLVQAMACKRSCVATRLKQKQNIAQQLPALSVLMLVQVCHTVGPLARQISFTQYYPGRGL